MLIRSAAIVILVLHALAAGVRADDPVPGVPTIDLVLRNGNVVRGTLRRESNEVSQLPGGGAVSVSKTYIQYLENGRSRRLDVSAAEASEIVDLCRDFAEPGKKYAVSRTTKGYAAGTPLSLTLGLTESGRLKRYSDAPPGRQDQLRADYEKGNPLDALVRYKFDDADREKSKRTGRTDPHGRIVLGHDGLIGYGSYEKSLFVHEIVQGSLNPAVAGIYPTVIEALAAARQQPPDLSKLRFAADFGPQYNGNAREGRARSNQLMPLIPIGPIRSNGLEYMAVVPVDLLKDYREGKIAPKDALFLIPPSVLRFVPDTRTWNDIVDDYLDLRRGKDGSPGRDHANIFVANQKTSDPQHTLMATLDSHTMVGRGGDAEARQQALDRQFDGLRTQIPNSLLGPDFLSKPKKGSGECGPGFAGLSPGG